MAYANKHKALLVLLGGSLLCVGIIVTLSVGQSTGIPIPSLEGRIVAHTPMFNSVSANAMYEQEGKTIHYLDEADTEITRAMTVNGHYMLAYISDDFVFPSDTVHPLDVLLGRQHFINCDGNTKKVKDFWYYVYTPNRSEGQNGFVRERFGISPCAPWRGMFPDIPSTIETMKPITRGDLLFLALSPDEVDLFSARGEKPSVGYVPFLPPATTECNDKKDNDNDSTVDYPNDQDCSGASDRSEHSTTPFKITYPTDGGVYAYEGSGISDLKDMIVFYQEEEKESQPRRLTAEWKDEQGKMIYAEDNLSFDGRIVLKKPPYAAASSNGAGKVTLRMEYANGTREEDLVRFKTEGKRVGTITNDFMSGFRRTFLESIALPLFPETGAKEYMDFLGQPDANEGAFQGDKPNKCGNQIDNNGNGRIDEGCLFIAENSETGQKLERILRTNLASVDDYKIPTSFWRNGKNTIHLSLATPGTPNQPIDTLQKQVYVMFPACTDGIDNDGDGKVDAAEDNGCTNAADGSERAIFIAGSTIPTASAADFEARIDPVLNGANHSSFSVRISVNGGTPKAMKENAVGILQNLLFTTDPARAQAPNAILLKQGTNEIVVELGQEITQNSVRQWVASVHPDAKKKYVVTIGSVCGDGRVASSEQCDDGNIDSGDGCSAGCVQEGSHRCSGEPSECLTNAPRACENGVDDDGDGGTDILFAERMGELTVPPLQSPVPFIESGLMLGISTRVEGAGSAAISIPRLTLARKDTLEVITERDVKWQEWGPAIFGTSWTPSGEQQRLTFAVRTIPDTAEQDSRYVIASVNRDHPTLKNEFGDPYVVTESRLVELDRNLNIVRVLQPTSSTLYPGHAVIHVALNAAKNSLLVTVEGELIKPRNVAEHIAAEYKGATLLIVDPVDFSMRREIQLPPSRAYVLAADGVAAWLLNLSDVGYDYVMTITKINTITGAEEGSLLLPGNNYSLLPSDPQSLLMMVYTTKWVGQGGSKQDYKILRIDPSNLTVQGTLNWNNSENPTYFNFVSPWTDARGTMFGFHVNFYETSLLRINPDLLVGELQLRRTESLHSGRTVYNHGLITTLRISDNSSFVSNVDLSNSTFAIQKVTNPPAPVIQYRFSADPECRTPVDAE